MQDKITESDKRIKLTDEFIKHFTLLSNLTESQLEKLVELFEQYVCFLESKDEILKLKNYEEQFSNYQEDEIENFISLSVFIITELYEHSIESTFDYLKKQKKLSLNEENIKNLSKYLSKIEPHRKRIIEIKKQRASISSGGVPTIDEIDYACNLRFIPKEKFKPQTQKSGDYTPEVNSLIPVALITIETENIIERNISFQTDIDGLEKLIDTLLAIQKEMILLKEIEVKDKDNRE